MLDLFASNLYLFAPLFLAFNIGLGLLFVWIAERSPMAAFWQSCAGLVGPFFQAVGAIFALYSAFLANDVWRTYEKAQTAVTREQQGIRELLRLAEAMGPQGQRLRELTIAFGHASAPLDWTTRHVPPVPAASVRWLFNETLFGSVAQAGPQVQNAAMNAIRDMRAGYLDRVEILTSTVGQGKWSAVFIFGVLTQIALVAVHLGKARAGMLAVTIFSIGMTASMIFILEFSEPFVEPFAVSLQPIYEALRSETPNTSLPGAGPRGPSATQGGSSDAAPVHDHD
jgi:hypothetical protein